VGQLNSIVNECSLLVAFISQCYVWKIEVIKGAILEEFSAVVFEADHRLIFIIWGVRFNRKTFGKLENLATSSRRCSSKLWASFGHEATACCIVTDRQPQDDISRSRLWGSWWGILNSYVS
jgi:hypothetical protein